MHYYFLIIFIAVLVFVIQLKLMIDPKTIPYIYVLPIIAYLLTPYYKYLYSNVVTDGTGAEFIRLYFPCVIVRNSIDGIMYGSIGAIIVGSIWLYILYIKKMKSQEKEIDAVDCPHCHEE